MFSNSSYSQALPVVDTIHRQSLPSSNLLSWREETVNTKQNSHFRCHRCHEDKVQHLDKHIYTKVTSLQMRLV